MVEFGKLQEATFRLNRESDSINQIIKAVQEKIGSLNPGLEVWLYDVFSREKGKTAVIWSYYLGYAKIGGNWVLAIKGEEEVEFCNGNKNEAVQRAKDIIYQPLLKASRDVIYQPLLEASRETRIAALKRMQDLIDLLERRVEAAIEAIEEAKNSIAVNK